MKRDLVVAGRVLVLALAVGCGRDAASGCGGAEPKADAPFEAPVTFPARPDAPPTRAHGGSPRVAPPGSEPGRGHLRVVFDAPVAPDHGPIADVLFHSGRLRGLVEALDRAIVLPSDVYVRFRDADGPLYDPRKREIVFDYGFVADTAAMLARVEYAEKPSDLRAFVVQVVEFVLTHEVGHALVDLFELPLLGSEEDAVDSLATLLLLELVPDGNLVALTAADLHAIESLGQRDLGMGDYWGDHLLGLQRFARIVCLVYGSDAARHAPLLERHQGLRDRRDACVEDFASQRRAWKRLFRDHLRDEAGADVAGADDPPGSAPAAPDHSNGPSASSMSSSSISSPRSSASSRTSSASSATSSSTSTSTSPTSPPDVR